MKKKILIVLLILIFIYCIGGVIYSIVVSQNQSDSEKLDLITINNYDYVIDSLKETALYKNEFNILKSNLESSEVDFKNYAISLAKLYIIDLYTLSSKSNKYDITSSQYVYSSAQENYKLKVSESLYKYIEDNSEGRDQELPEVSEVLIKTIEETTYLIGSSEYSAYKVDIEWLYKKELGYDTEATLMIINENNLLSVVEEFRNENNVEENKNS